MKRFLTLTLIGAYALPMIAVAQLSTEIKGSVDVIANVVNATIPILIGLAVVYFLWGVIQFVISKGPDDKTKARDTMIYGIIGLFVIVAVWGIIAALGGALGIKNPGEAEAPIFDIPGAE